MELNRITITTQELPELLYVIQVIRDNELYQVYYANTQEEAIEIAKAFSKALNLTITKNRFMK